MAYFVVCRKGLARGATPLMSCISDEDWYLAEICYEHLQKAIIRLQEEDEGIVAFELDDVPDFITTDELKVLLPHDILPLILSNDFGTIRDEVDKFSIQLRDS